MVRVYYSPKYGLSGCSFDTTRKAKWIADSLTHSPMPNVELVEPEPLTEQQVSDVHDPGYVRSIKTGTPRELAESQGFDWDAGLWPMVLSSNGGAVAAALTALEHGVAGSLSSGLHHARAESGMGFCTFNGLVLAAKAALGAGAKSVLILDLDAHCGGGTASMIASDDRIQQVDVSVCTLDRYRTDSQNRLAVVNNAAEYLPTVKRLLNQLDREGQTFDLCIYNAGMDPFEGCDIGGVEGITLQILDARERLVFEWCQQRHLPVAFVLAGGYVGSRLNQNRLVELHRKTLLAASQVDCRRTGNILVSYATG